MKYHQGIRAEIETRGPKFNTCEELGQSLLAQRHKNSDEVSRHEAELGFLCYRLRLLSRYLDLSIPVYCTM